MTFEIGGYRAHRHLGGGATAEVYAGRRIRDGHPVAMKVMAAADLESLRREAALARAVDHAHVPEVVEVVADGERAALVTELAAGGSLADLLLDRGRLGPAETLTVLIPLAAVLAVAHERQVVHGDVTPANVLLDRAGRPLLGDLGAGRAASEAGIPVAATPGYLAPEVARGGEPGPAADLFALGAVAHACLTGRPAWPADTARDVVIQAAGGQWPDPGPTPERPALAGIVRSLLDPDPAARPGAAALYLDLKAAGAAAPLLVARGGPPARSRTGAGRHRWPDQGDDDPDPDPDDGVEAPPFPRPGQDPRLADPGHAARARAVTQRRDGVAAGTDPDDDDPGDGSGRWRWRPPLRQVGVALAAVALLLTAAGGGWWWARAAAPRPVAADQLGSPASASPAIGSASSGAPRSPSVRSGGPDLRTTARAPATPTAATADGGSGLPDPSAGTSATTGTAGTATTGPVSRAPASGAPPAGTPIRGRSSGSGGTAGAAPSAPVIPAVTTAGASTTRAGPTGTGSPFDWAGQVVALDRARSRALAELDADGLDAVYTAGSAALEADRQVISALRAAGRRVPSAAHAITGVRVLTTGATVTVVVTESLPSYPVLDATGTVVGHTEPRTSGERTLTLVDTPAGVRIAAVA